MTQVILLVVWAALFYSLQWTFYIKYARKYDGMRVAQVRNIAMIITWIPLVFLGWWIEQKILAIYIRPIIISAIIWALHVFISYKSYTYVPAWISQVIKKSVKSLWVLIISLYVLQEVFTTGQWRWLAIITFWALRLGSYKIDIHHLNLQNIKLWTVLIILAGFLSALNWYFFSLYNSSFDPFIASYILESSIGIIYLLYILFVSFYNPQPTTGIQWLMTIEPRDLLYMSLNTFFVFWWTLCSAYALTLGWYGFTWLLSIIGVPIAFLLVRIVLKEEITRMQAAAISIILVGLWIV